MIMGGFDYLGYKLGLLSTPFDVRYVSYLYLTIFPSSVSYIEHSPLSGKVAPKPLEQTHTTRLDRALPLERKGCTQTLKAQYNYIWGVDLKL